MSKALNVILVVFDTMRKDMLSVYGGQANTPKIDAFCKDAVVYQNCVAPSTWTLPSHASFFTGKYPSAHGLHETYEIKGQDLLRGMNDIGGETLADYLKGEGYTTIGVSGNPWLYSESGFSKGFHFFMNVDDGRLPPAEREAMDRAASYGATVGEVVTYLARRGRIGELYELYSVYRKIRKREKSNNFPLIKGGDRVVRSTLNASIEEPFFLFLNFFEMHDPYTQYEQRPSNNIPGRPGVSMADLFGLRQMPRDIIGQIRRQYYRSATHVDSFFGEIISFLKQRNLYDDSLILALSDHGQALKERNYYGHSIFLYDEIVQVPLIVKYPKQRAQVTPPNDGDRYQSLVDIPTLVRSVLEGGGNDDVLARDAVFSEAFGVPNATVRKAPENVRKAYDVPRKAVYMDGYKLVVTWPDKEIEEFTYHGKVLDHKSEQDRVGSLLNELDVLKYSEREVSLEATNLASGEEEYMTNRLRELGYA